MLSITFTPAKHTTSLEFIFLILFYFTFNFLTLFYFIFSLFPYLPVKLPAKPIRTADVFYTFTLCKETQSVPHSKFNLWSSLRFLVGDHSFRACVFLKWRNRQFVDQTFARHLMCGRGLFLRPYPSLWLLGFTPYKLNIFLYRTFLYCLNIKKMKQFRERTPC